MKNTVKHLIVMSMVTVGLSVAGTALAKGPRQMGDDNMPQRDMKEQQGRFDRGGLRQLASELNLTTEQQQQILTILMKNRLDRMQDRQDVQAPFQEMFDMLINEEFDEAKVRAMVQQQIAEREQEREDRFVERAKMLSDIKAVLTPEQQEQVKQLGADFFRGAWPDAPQGREPRADQGRDPRQNAPQPGLQQDDRGARARQDRRDRRNDRAQNRPEGRRNMPEKGRDFDRGGFPPVGGLPFMMLAELNLTEDQTQQAAEIFARYQVNRQEQRQNFRASGKPMFDALSQDDFDEQKIRELYQQQVSAEQNPAQQMEDHIVEMAKMCAEFKAILTPEQLDTLKQNAAELTENSGKQGGKFGPKPPRPGGWF